MNYESMSNFEINKAVANLLDAKFMLDEFVFGNEEREVVYLCEKDGIDSIFPVCEFNPCGNPADAWPIIVEHGICIEKRSRLTDFWVAITWHQISGNEYRPIHQHSDKNPLRAAMIVFLMMSES